MLYTELVTGARHKHRARARGNPFRTLKIAPPFTIWPFVLTCCKPMW